MKLKKDPKPHFYPHKPLKNVTPLFSFHRINTARAGEHVDGLARKWDQHCAMYNYCVKNKQTIKRSINTSPKSA